MVSSAKNGQAISRGGGLHSYPQGAEARDEQAGLGLGRLSEGGHRREGQGREDEAGLKGHGRAEGEDEGRQIRQRQNDQGSEEFALKTVVVDASVVAKWYIAEENSEKAVQIRDLHSTGKVTLTSPLLVLCEVGNTLTKHPSFAGQDAAKAFQSLLDLGLRLRSFAESSLLEKAFMISRELGITFYDAAYVALTADGPLITADKDLCMKIRRYCEVQLLSETNPEDLPA